MKRTAMAVLILLLLFSQGAAASNRNMTLEADGIIEIESKAGNDTSAAAFKISGEGHLKLEHAGRISSSSLAHDLQLFMITADKPLRRMEAISAFKAGDNYTYAIMAAPGRAETGALKSSYQASEGDYTEIEIDAEVFTAGEFRNYLAIYNPVSGMTIDELIRVIGQAYYQETLKISEIEKEEE